MEKKVIVSEKSPAAIGPYSQAIEYNGLIYTSGVIGVNPATGEVGATIEEQTTQVFENLKGLFTGAFPARSCVEVARLPKDLLIEVEVTAIKDR